MATIISLFSRLFTRLTQRMDQKVGWHRVPLLIGLIVLVASRRLNSDRFFTTDYNPTVYSQAGFDWVRDNDMTTILLRHFPTLKPVLAQVKNPFAPWPHVKV